MHAGAQPMPQLTLHATTHPSHTGPLLFASMFCRLLARALSHDFEAAGKLADFIDPTARRMRDRHKQQ